MTLLSPHARPTTQSLLLSLAILLSACGGGSDNGAAPSPAPGSPPVPTPAPAPAPTPAPEGAVTYYFSDCQAGASAGCTPGNDANAGTSPSAPKRTPASIDINALAAGSQLLFVRGGAWANVNLYVRNLNATPSQPLVFDAYGSGARPVLATTTENTVNFGYYSDAVQDGGYTFRNFKLDGQGRAQWGFFLMGATRNVRLENNEITGYQIAVHFQNMASGNEALQIRDNHIHHNSAMGMLGDANNLVIEGNLIEANNFSGSGFNHGLYLGGHAHGGVVRNNRFINNSVCTAAPCDDGQPVHPTMCRGGNLTVHGQWDGLLIEGNTISQVSSNGGCYGISVTPGYTLPEFFRNVVVRGNTVINLGGCAVCFGAAVGPIAENNLLINLNNSWMSGVVLATNVQSPGVGGDDVDDGAIIRNNTLCSAYLAAGTELVVSRNAGTVTQSGNVLRTGPDASSGPCAR